MRIQRRLSLLPLVLLLRSTPAPAPQPRRVPYPEVVRIWPGQAPGTTGWKASEQAADVTLPNVGKIHVITNVSVPTLTIFRPAIPKRNGTAMVVLPGGSFRALAWDVDGVETAQWLAGKGITAFLLKYRVRPPQIGESFGQTLEDFSKATRERRAIVVEDAKQAIRFVRSHAQPYGVVQNRVGIIGFSAGAMAAVDVALTKDVGSRPNFAVAMYGAALSDAAPNADAPPMFIAAAEDDPQLPAINSVEIFRRWSKAGVPAELHIYEKGGHGFGFRSHGSTSDHWPTSFEAWLAAQGYLTKVQR